jgi:hypothetical protein
MGLFGGKKDAPQEPMNSQTGRRRPQPSTDADKRPQAFSYYSQRSGNTPTAGRQPLDPELARQENIKMDSSPTEWWRSRPVVIAGSVAGIILLGVVLNLSGDPKVVPVTKGGNSYFLQDMQVYQQTAAKRLGSSLLNKNKLTVNATGLEQELDRQYPEISKATVSIPLIGSRPTVYIEPNRPSFILTTSDSGAYLMDDAGRALVSISQISDPGELSVPTIEDRSGVRVTLGSQALPSTTVAFAETFVRYLKAAGVEFGNLTLPAASSELDIAIKGKPYLVKTNLMGDARLEAGTFLAAKGRLEKDKTTPVKYIDVRVPERAYYQ